jgi:hypothetical protein
MTASRGHPFLRPGFLNSYTGYSIGCFITWAVLLTVLEVTGKRDTLDKVFSVLLRMGCGVDIGDTREGHLPASWASGFGRRDIVLPRLSSELTARKMG